MSTKESVCIRVARISCETPADFRRMRELCLNNAKVAGARAGALGEKPVIDEERFRYLKNACRATEIGGDS
jgi:hypothetical protein